ncbi:hypothetical protein EVA_18752 [gut metagenome]|uniref:Uncharacterized protein n=1 Tax=gut metagenome TaxID=749906 RepID=J9C018_9ZZZZ
MKYMRVLKTKRWTATHPTTLWFLTWDVSCTTMTTATT